MEYLTCHFRELLDMHPGDSFEMIIEDYLQLVHTRGGNYTIKAIKVIGYYWDDDDHHKLDFWIWEDGKDIWTCKLMDLTVESRKKLYEYIESQLKK